jgi:AMIN domain
VKDFPPNLAFRQPWSRCSLRTDLCVVIAMAMLVLGAPQLHSQTPVQPEVNPGSKPAASSAASKNVAIRNVPIRNVPIRNVPMKIAAIKSFRIVQEKEGPAIEILSTRPLVPSIQAISDPDRLVIDLPNARLETQHKPIRSARYAPTSFNRIRR